jgi:hypothetical protein
VGLVEGEWEMNVGGVGEYRLWRVIMRIEVKIRAVMRWCCLSVF